MLCKPWVVEADLGISGWTTWNEQRTSFVGCFSRNGLRMIFKSNRWIEMNIQILINHQKTVMNERLCNKLVSSFNLLISILNIL